VLVSNKQMLTALIDNNALITRWICHPPHHRWPRCRRTEYRIAGRTGRGHCWSLVSRSDWNQNTHTSQKTTTTTTTNTHTHTHTHTTITSKQEKTFYNTKLQSCQANWTRNIEKKQEDSLPKSTVNKIQCSRGSPLVGLGSTVRLQYWRMLCKGDNGVLCERAHSHTHTSKCRQLCFFILKYKMCIAEQVFSESKAYWHLVKRSERFTSMPKVAGLNPSGGSDFAFRSDLLLTVRGSSTWALIMDACLLCYPGNTLYSQRLEPPKRAG
jgi:hypothetical protein